MESNAVNPPPQDPRSLVATADQTRQRLAHGLRLPVGLRPATAAAVAVQVATAAYGIAQQTTAGLAVLLAGLAVFLLVGALMLHRFRQLNGVRLDGLASQLLLGSGTLTSLTYLASLAAATWAGFASQWWLVAVAAVLGGVGYALGTQRWWQAYRQDPVTQAPGASPRVLAGLVAVAILGLAALLVVG